MCRRGAAQFASLPSAALVLIMTHEYQIDFDIDAATVQRPCLTGVGLIGSNAKRFDRRPARAGLMSEAIARLINPIGASGVGGKLLARDRDIGRRANPSYPTTDDGKADATEEFRRPTAPCAQSSGMWRSRFPESQRVTVRIT
jgi:hypothetical protein